MEYFEIFVRNLYDSGIMRPDEFESLREMYRKNVKKEIQPNVIFLLRSSIDENFRRIQKRSRKCEKNNLSIDYLKTLAAHYARFEERVKNEWDEVEVIEVETDGVCPEKVFEEVRRHVLKKLNRSSEQ